MALAMDPHIANALQFSRSQLSKIIVLHSEKPALTLIFLHNTIQCASSNAKQQTSCVEVFGSFTFIAMISHRN